MQEIVRKGGIVLFEPKKLIQVKILQLINPYHNTYIIDIYEHFIS